MNTTVYIFNMSEDVWPFICSMADPKAIQQEIEENAHLGDRDLFSISPEDHVLLVGSEAVSDEFLAYYQSCVGPKDVRHIVPKHHSGQICRDILDDEEVLKEIIAASNSTKQLTLVSYTASTEFYQLVWYLRNQGLLVVTPESPEEEDAWTVNFYGSKSGIRQLAQQSRAVEPDFVMADGLISMGIVDTARIAAKKYLKEHGVVLKTNKGHSGAGLLIFRPGDLPEDFVSCEIALLKYLKKDPYWEKFPIVIEEYIQSSLIGGGFPSVEFKILKSGKIEYLYFCGMRLTPAGVFQGVEIHNSVFSDRVGAQMVDTGFFVAERYAAAGYRGYFDIDFIAGKNGTLYVTESNVRRTGGTHVYSTALRLFGRDFMYLTYILSNNNYPLPSGAAFSSFTSVVKKLDPVLFNKQTREGVIIVSENILLKQHALAYVVFGNSKKRAVEIEEQMMGLLK